MKVKGLGDTDVILRSSPPADESTASAAGRVGCTCRYVIGAGPEDVIRVCTCGTGAGLQDQPKLTFASEPASRAEGLQTSPAAPGITDGTSVTVLETRVQGPGGCCRRWIEPAGDLPAGWVEWPAHAPGNDKAQESPVMLGGAGGRDVECEERQGQARAIGG